MTFNEYQQKAALSSYIDQQAEPAKTIADGILEETLEAFTDDGKGEIMSYLYSPEIGLHPRHKHTVAKELGDVTWYISEYERFNGRRLGNTALLAVEPITPDRHLIDVDIEEFDQLALQHGWDYNVRNHKFLAMLDAAQPDMEEDDKIRESSPRADTSPGYVLQRVFSRLTRLTGGMDNVCGPPGNVDFDDIEVINRSPTDALWVMSYVAQTRFGYSLAEITDLNLKKLNRRIANDTVLSGTDQDRSQYQPNELLS